jgi:hypothetical protein
MNIATLTPKELRRAADLKERIDALQNELSKILGNWASAPVAATEALKNGRRKRRMSAAGRAAISAASKARWARVRGTASSEKSARKNKRRMTAAGRAALSAAATARWAKAKKAGKTTL